MGCVTMRTILLALSLLIFAAPSAAAAGDRGTPVFALVMTRHGVRSFTKAPPAYTWPDWSPVAPGFLSAHGYALATYLGRYYRSYFASIGLRMGCGSRGTYVYADLDQRTLETARALIEGACGSATGLPLYHDATMGPAVNDGLFDGADFLVGEGKVETAASRAAVAAAAPNPPAAIVTQHAAEFAALQSILDARCSGGCPPANVGDSTISASEGLAELRGPLDAGSSYAESLFLEYAQCGPSIDPAKLADAMRLHVLAYDVNARNAYNPLVRGSNIFAHIVGLLEEKAAMGHPDVSVPDVSHANVAILSGHDTQLGALGGILNAHWPLGNGLVLDDMPPGGALVFELYRQSSGEYRVHLHFVYQTLAQFRHASPLPDGIATSPVRMPGCSGDDCSVPLSRLATLAHQLSQQGFVQHGWTPSSDASVNLAPLGDPPWTHCDT
jgi:4-phytase / acid phosphatase